MRGCRVAVLAAAVLLAGCASTAPPPGDPPRPVPDADRGEQRTLLTAEDAGRPVSDFRVLAAAPLPDGTLVVQWDPHAPSGGDDREPFSDPQLSILGAGGQLDLLELPADANREPDDAASLLTTDAEGRIYLWRGSGANTRLVVGAPDLGWEQRQVQVDTSFAGTPEVAVAPDGAVYLSADDGVYRLAPDDTLSRVVGVRESTGSEDPGAPPLPADQPPRPASEITLSGVWGLAVVPDGTVFVSNRHELVAIDTAGILSLVTTFSDFQRDLGILSTLDPPFLWSSLAVDADGSLLVSDSYQQLVADLDGPAIVARHAVVVSNGLNASWDPHSDLLLRELDPEALQAGPSSPDQLAAYGR